jgi:hypothetical protein
MLKSFAGFHFPLLTTQSVYHDWEKERKIRSSASFTYIPYSQLLLEFAERYEISVEELTKEAYSNLLFVQRSPKRLRRE